jgi:type VI secretion system secreted protein Hcp
MSDFDQPPNVDPGLGLSNASGGLAAFSRAASFFLSAKGMKSGTIQGGTTVKHQAGKTECLGFQTKIESPRDPHSGLATGKRMHFPLHVAFRLDKSAPKWFTVCTTNETLSKVTLDCIGGISKASGIGEGSGYKSIYTIELVNANVQKYKQFTGATGELCLTLAFTYMKITYTWVDGGIVGHDDWLSPTA